VGDYYLASFPGGGVSKREKNYYTTPVEIEIYRYILYRYKTVEVSNHLFEISNGRGNDLISTNINRGRDHGLPPYMEYRKMCKLHTTNRFSGLIDHSPQNRILLSKVYE
jgi:hypothetical protein